jgi:hypothetical protein
VVSGKACTEKFHAFLFYKIYSIPFSPTKIRFFFVTGNSFPKKTAALCFFMCFPGARPEKKRFTGRSEGAQTRDCFRMIRFAGQTVPFILHSPFSLEKVPDPDDTRARPEISLARPCTGGLALIDLRLNKIMRHKMETFSWRRKNNYLNLA